MGDTRKIGVGFGVMILKEDKVLLGRRHEDPEKADSVFKSSDVWTMPGGKLKYGESFNEGAAREVIEETGLDIKDAKVICVNEDRNEHAHFVTVGILSIDFEGEPEVREPDEITEWRWFDLNDLPKNLYFPTEKILKSYQEGRVSVSE